MKPNLVLRTTTGVNYYVDPNKASTIYLDKLFFDSSDLSSDDVTAESLKHAFFNRSQGHEPIQLVWELTNRCNFNCDFCYIRSNKKVAEVDFDEANQLIGILVDKGLFHVYLSGGECLLHQDFIKIYTMLKIRGIIVTVFTNGSLINEEIMSLWTALPPCCVEITLYDDDFRSDVYRNVIQLKKAGIKVQLKFTLTKSNLFVLDKVQNWTDANGFDLLIDCDLFDGTDDDHCGLVGKYELSLEDKKRLCPWRYKHIRSESPRIRTMLPCKSIHGGFHIAADFTLSLCNALQVRWDLRLIRADRALRNLHDLIEEYKDEPMDGCDGCHYPDACTMCLGHLEKTGTKLIVPSGYCLETQRIWSYLTS